MLALIANPRSPISQSAITSNAFKRNLGSDLKTIRLKRHQLPGMVRDNPHGPNIQRSQNLGADPILALLALQTDALIRVGTVLPVISQFVATFRASHLVQI